MYNSSTKMTQLPNFGIQVLISYGSIRILAPHFSSVQILCHTYLIEITFELTLSKKKEEVS